MGRFKTRYKKVCLLCGKKFESKLAKGLYCDDLCKNKHFYLTKQRVIKKCKGCGKESELYYKSEFCHSSCSLKYKSKLNTQGETTCVNVNQE